MTNFIELVALLKQLQKKKDKCCYQVDCEGKKLKYTSTVVAICLNNSYGYEPEHQQI